MSGSDLSIDQMQNLAPRCYENKAEQIYKRLSKDEVMSLLLWEVPEEWPGQ